MKGPFKVHGDPLMDALHETAKSTTVVGLDAEHKGYIEIKALSTGTTLFKVRKMDGTLVHTSLDLPSAAEALSTL